MSTTISGGVSKPKSATKGKAAVVEGKTRASKKGHNSATDSMD